MTDTVHWEAMCVVHVMLTVNVRLKYNDVKHIYFIQYRSIQLQGVKCGKGTFGFWRNTEFISSFIIFCPFVYVPAREHIRVS